MASTLDPSQAFNKPKCFGLNVDDAKHPFSNLLSAPTASSAFTKSDSDEQLILFFSFNETVSLTGFSIVPAPAEDADADSSAPLTVKVYLNQVNFSFDDVDSVTPSAVVQLATSATTEGGGVLTAQLKPVTFNRVNSLTLFVESNQKQTEYTALAAVRFLGKPVGGTDVSQLKKQREDDGE